MPSPSSDTAMPVHRIRKSRFFNGASTGRPRLSGRLRRVLKLEALRKFGEYLVQLLYLGIVVGSRDLNTETHLGLGHQGVGGESHVDPAVEQEPPDRVDVFGTTEGDLDDG